MDNAKRKKRIVFIIALLVLVIAFIGIGGTAAYFVTNVTNQDSISVISVGGASITLTLTNGTTDKTITATDVIPGWSDTKNFKVTLSNDSGKDISYDINLIIIKNEFGSDMEYTLADSGDAGYGSVSSWTSINSNTAANATTQKLASGTFSSSSAAHNYVLTVRLKETGTNQAYQGKTFTAYPSISTSDKILSQTPADKSKIWNTTEIASVQNSLLSAIKENTNIYTNIYTTPMSDIAIKDEGLIVLDDSTNALNSIDDTGNASFFFRGAVENNYVEFASKCWRIVRIDGNNNIKLVLYNDNTSNAANPCMAEGEKLAFINDGKKVFFSSILKFNASVGWMYGTPDSSSFEDEHAHTNDSTALATLKTWYNTYFVNATDTNSKKYQDYLADVVWCNDISTVSGGNPNWSGDTGLGYGTNKTGYGYYNRKMNNESSTYKCDNALSRYTSTDLGKNNAASGAVYKMGLLNADEVAFAGADAYATSNTAYYLNKNASGNWWLLSPFFFLSFIVGGYVTSSGGLGYSSGMSVFNVLRPAVSLKSTATISSGNGTSSNPYVVSGY